MSHTHNNEYVTFDRRVVARIVLDYNTECNDDFTQSNADRENRHDISEILDRTLSIMLTSGPSHYKDSRKFARIRALLPYYYLSAYLQYA